MKVNKYQKYWHEISCILHPAVKRERHIDLRKNVDWDELNQIVLGSALILGCSFIEASGIRRDKDHLKVLFELRNAFVHNDRDLSENNNQDALNLCEMYLENQSYKKITGDKKNAFYQLNNTHVVLNDNLYHFIGRSLAYFPVEE